MKNTLILLVSMLALSSFTTLKIETIVIKTQIYCDHCKKCESCGDRLNQLIYLKGIKAVDLDEKAMTITVKYNPKKISPEKIRTEISKLGYDADDVKADPAAYEKLDDCCKKQ